MKNRIHPGADGGLVRWAVRLPSGNRVNLSTDSETVTGWPAAAGRWLAASHERGHVLEAALSHGGHGC
jgi:hypothetical protein